MNDVPEARFIPPVFSDDPQIPVLLDKLERLVSEWDGLDDGPYRHSLVDEMRLICTELDLLGHVFKY